MQQPLAKALPINLADLSIGTGTGPLWGHESSDLDLTLLRWTAEQHIAAHINDEVDVLLICIVGAGEVTINDVVYSLTAGHALLIPKGATRAMYCTADQWSYLSVHRRRRGLWPTIGGKPFGQE